MANSNHVEDYDERDIQIRAAIDDGMHPILQFEAEVLLDQIEQHTGKQQELGQAMGKAMTESSETWHDNAPAEAITAASKILTSRALHTIKMQQDSVIFPYPDPEYDIATLGTVADIEVVGKRSYRHVLLTGAVRVIDVIPQNDLPEGTTLATIKSPIGRAIFGRKAGEEISYTVNNNTVAVIVNSLYQYRPSKILTE